MMRSNAKGGRSLLVQLLFHCQRSLALGEASPVANAENVCVYGKCLCPEGAIHHDIGSLASNAWQLRQHVAVCRDFTVEIPDQNFGQAYDVFRL